MRQISQNDLQPWSHTTAVCITGFAMARKVDAASAKSISCLSIKLCCKDQTWRINFNQNLDQIYKRDQNRWDQCESKIIWSKKSIGIESREKWQDKMSGEDQMESRRSSWIIVEVRDDNVIRSLILFVRQHGQLFGTLWVSVGWPLNHMLFGLNCVVIGWKVLRARCFVRSRSLRMLWCVRVVARISGRHCCRLHKAGVGDAGRSQWAANAQSCTYLLAWSCVVFDTDWIRGGEHRRDSKFHEVWNGCTLDGDVCMWWCVGHLMVVFQPCCGANLSCRLASCACTGCIVVVLSIWLCIWAVVHLSSLNWKCVSAYVFVHRTLIFMRCHSHLRVFTGVCLCSMCPCVSLVTPTILMCLVSQCVSICLRCTRVDICAVCAVCL